MKALFPRALILLVAVGAPSVVGAEQPVVQPGADAPAIAGDGRGAETLLFYFVQFYDMQERAGLCLSWGGCLPTGASASAFREDWRASDGSYTSQAGALGTIRFVADPPGTEYLWRVTVPGLPPVAGYVGTDLGFYYTAYPIQGYDLGMRVKKRTISSSSTFGIEADLFYSDSPMASSPVLPINNMSSYSTRRMVHTVEYLPGNALHDKGFDTFEVPNGSARADNLGMFWGLSEPPLPLNVNFDTRVPSGPMRVSTWIEGYTTASLLIENVQGGVVLEPDWMFTKSNAPNAGPTPGDVMWNNLPWPPSDASRLKALQWSLSGETTELSNLKRHLDLSGDGVQDVADLLLANAGAMAASAPLLE